MFPKLGVKVAEAVDGEKTLYYIKAMISLFCEHGNYENRARARTRYMQDTLGDALCGEFNKHLKAALEEGGLDIEVEKTETAKKGETAEFNSDYVIPQKQNGLYAVKFHPIGGNLTPDMLKSLYETIKDMESVSVRVSPDETIYIVNCNGSEAKKVLDVTDCGARSDIEESVACIGASVCQQGLRDSLSLLAEILKAVKPCGFAPDALPALHISGCMSSCGTHEIGKIGFHGKVKMVDKKPVPGFTVNINGCDRQGHEHFGEELGVMAAEEIPEFIVELGKAVTAEGVSYDEFAKTSPEKLTEIIRKYI